MIPPAELRFDTRFVRQALGFDATEKLPQAVFTGVSTDSRTVKKGDLFVALKGDQFDGHAFIPQALKQGAAAALCLRDYPAGSGAHIAVDDTLDAYRRLAHAWRRQFDIPVVAVAGAVGKTTTKEMLSAALSGKFASVLKTEASENGFIGIPKTLLRLTAAHRVAVIEIGIDDVGAMDQHLELVEPRASVVTAIAEEHMENLGTLERVAHEEGRALVWVATRGGVVAINADDPYLAPYGQSLGGRLLVYRLSKPRPGDTPNLQGKFHAGSGTLLVTGMGWQGAEFTVPLPGSHNAQNLLAAIAMARGLELTEDEIRRGLESFVPPYGRSQLKTLSNGLRVLCDFYNASPASMRAGMKLASELPRTGKNWAILGDMLELGERELDLHRELAEPLNGARFDRVLLFGPRMKALAEKLGSAARHYEDVDPLAKEVVDGARPADLVFIKGSRGMRLERVFAKLCEKHPEK